MNTDNLKRELMAEYKYRTELHAHTKPVSPCSDIPPEAMIELYKNLGYDAITITNHFMIHNANQNREDFIKSYIRDFEKTYELGKKVGMNVLLGAEIRFTENDNDYLLYGLTIETLEEIYDLLSLGLENFRKNHPMRNSLFIQAHPFRNGMTEINPYLLDGIEVFNLHPGHNSRVAVASAYAKEKGKSIITAGTDFHHFGHEGMAALRTKTLPSDSFELAQLLKNRDYILEVADNNIIIP